MLRLICIDESAEEFIQVVKTYRTDEGLRQNVEKPGVYIENIKYLSNFNAMIAF
jgi:hypothetical protein